MSYNKVAIAQDRVPVRFTIDVGSNVYLGSGLNLSDPLKPELSPLSPFASTPKRLLTFLNEASVPIKVETILTASSEVSSSTTNASFASDLYAHFRGSYGIVSASAAVRKIKQTEHNTAWMMAKIEALITDKPIDPSQLKWTDPPTSEDRRIKDDEERLNQFISQYGSHFVQSIVYGFRVVVVGSFKSESSTEREAFAIAFKAKFGGGSAGGGATSQQEEILRQRKEEIKAVVIAGDIDPPQSVVIIGFDEITDFLAKIRDEKISLSPGPVEGVGRSYHSFLLDYPATRRLFDPTDGQLAESKWGVPRGTIIAWFPGDTDFEIDANKVSTLKVPPGWSLCDGRPGTPDLIDRFPLGAAGPDEVGSPSGSVSHSHTGVAGMIDPSQAFYFKAGGGTDQTPKANHQHSLAVDPAQHLPPSTKVLFLIKN